MKVSFTVLTLFAAFANGENAEENVGIDDSYLFEGDLVLEPGQRLAAEFGLETRGSLKNRLWPNGIVPYTIASDLSSQPMAMQAIENAMNEWSSLSCIRFVPRTTEASYIEFFKGKGCYSSLGRTGKKQQISLAAGCWGKMTVAHEIAHALGFAHEQSRPDRDDYVTINYENIQTDGFDDDLRPLLEPEAPDAASNFGWCVDRSGTSWCNKNARYCHWMGYMKSKCASTCNLC